MTLETDAAPAVAADNSPLTIDQHVELMNTKAAPAPKKGAAKPAEAPEPEQIEDTSETDTELSPEGEGEAVVEDTEDSEADTQSAEGAEGEPEEANAEGEEEGQAEPEPPAIEPPKFWDAEGKESFAKLSPKEQQAVLKYEEQRTKAVAKAMQESAETRKSYEAKQKQLLDVASRIEEHYVDPGLARMKEWEDYFASEGAEELSAQNPGEFLRLQTVYAREKRELNEAIAAKQRAEREAFASYTQEQARLIPELIPELADEKEGPKRKQELTAYLRENGFEPDRIQGISAKEAQIAWKAKQFDALPKDLTERLRKAEAYDKSMKLASKAPAPKPKPQAGPTAPATGQGQRPSTSEARFKALNSKQSLNADEHTELMLLKSKLRK